MIYLQSRQTIPVSSRTRKQKKHETEIFVYNMNVYLINLVERIFTAQEQCCLQKRESPAAFVFAAKEMLNITSCQQFPVKIEKEKLSRMDASFERRCWLRHA